MSLHKKDVDKYILPVIDWETLTAEDWQELVWHDEDYLKYTISIISHVLEFSR